MNSIIIATIVSFIVISIIYTLTGWKKIFNCYKMWLTNSYWTNYNIIEAFSWGVKAIIIIPGLIFGIQIWQLYFLALFTSATLIWASNKKLLPTLVGFNTLWIWLALVIITENILNR